MTPKQKKELLLDNANKAIRTAVRKVVAERKLHGQPIIIWKNGKVARIKADQLK